MAFSPLLPSPRAICSSVRLDFPPTDCGRVCSPGNTTHGRRSRRVPGREARPLGAPLLLTHKGRNPLRPPRSFSGQQQQPQASAGAGTGETEIEDDGTVEEFREGQLCLLTGGPDACDYLARPVVAADLHLCAELMHSVHFDTGVQDWVMILRYCKDDVYGVFHSDRLVGLVSAVPYRSCWETTPPSASGGGRAPPFGWLGNVVVHPEFRGKGLAHMLLSYGIRFLKARHACGHVLLDASDMGKPVYAKLGFADFASVYRMRVVDRSAAHAWARSDSTDSDSDDEGLSTAPPLLETTRHASLPEVLQLDRKAFGGDRGLLLERWMRHIPGSSFHARTSDGDVCGYSFTHTREECDYIGPVVAKDARVARALLKASLHQILRARRRKEVVVLVMGSLCTACDEGSERGGIDAGLGMDWALELGEGGGFVCDEVTTRQVLQVGGDSGGGLEERHPGRLDMIVACGSLDLG